MTRKILLLLPWLLCALWAQSGVGSLQYYWNDGSWDEAATIALSGGQSVDDQVAVALGQAQEGINHLHLRVVSLDGTASLPATYMFYKAPDAPASPVAAAEYYWNDGSWDEAATVAFSGGLSVDEQLAIALGQAQPGINHLHLRVLGQDGASSQPIAFMFYKTLDSPASPVAAAEYFWDADPGLGQGTALTVTPGTTLDELVTLSLEDLDFGLHYLGLRVQTEAGVWSLPVWRQAFRMLGPELDDIVALGWHFTGNAAPPEHSSLALPLGPGQAVEDSLAIPLHQLVEGQTYLLHVYAVNGSGIRSQEVVLPHTVDWTPRHPVLSFEGGVVLLSWDPVLGATGYQVLAAASPEGPFELVASPVSASYAEAPADLRFYQVKAAR
jgi:hypothetical protein